MAKVTDETIKQSYKPFDVVTDKYGNVGLIQEVSVNECQNYPDQISYSVTWLIEVRNTKNAWFHQSELESHCNLFVKIAEMTCHPFSNNAPHVKRFFGETEKESV